MPDPHEAPGGLELLRSFLNTVDLEHVADPREGPDELDDWCAGSGLGCAGARPADLKPLRGLREALRDLLSANAGEGDADAAWAALEPFAADVCLKMKVDRRGPALEPSGEGVAGTIAVLLAIVYDAVRVGTWNRLKACRQHTCRFAFYDRSKNASGTWCSMAVCGNRNKARRRRTRAKRVD